MGEQKCGDTIGIIHASHNDRGYVVYMSISTKLDRVDLVLERYGSDEGPTSYRRRVAHFRRLAQEALNNHVRQHGESHRGPMVEGEYKHRPVLYEAGTTTADQAITLAEWNDIYADYKREIDGQKYVLVNSRRGTVLVPVEVTSDECGERGEPATAR